MNGAYHYKEAEGLLDLANDRETPREMGEFFLRRAQVHATLALAAAQFEVSYTEDHQAWREALSTEPQDGQQ